MTHTRFKPGKSGNPNTTFQPGNPHRWVQGVSGSSGGKSSHRSRFEQEFNEALLTEGSPEEAAKLLWDAARNREPWAIQAICQRIAPQTQSLRLLHEVNDDGIDYDKFSDEQIAQIEAFVEQARVKPAAV